MKPIYRVEVFLNNGDVDTYLFDNEQAIKGSFAISWAKVNEPVYMARDSGGWVYVYVHIRCVGRYQCVAKGDIHSGATHF